MPRPDCDNQRGQDELAAALDCLSKRFEAHDLVVWNAVSVAFANMQGSALPKDDGLSLVFCHQGISGGKEDSLCLVAPKASSQVHRTYVPSCGGL
jgi:hypothetical protein